MLGSGRSCPKTAEQFTLLGPQFLRAAHGLGNFGANELAVAGGQPVHRHRHGVAGRAKFTGDRRLGAGVGSRLQVGPDAFEPSSFSEAFLFGAQLFQGAIEQGDCPAAVKRLVRRKAAVDLCQHVGGFARVDGQFFHEAAAARGLRMVMGVVQVVGEGAEEKGAKPAARAVRPPDRAATEEIGEESLREIFRIVGGMAASADLHVEWQPIGAAKGG